MQESAFKAINIIETCVKQYPMLAYVQINNASRAFFKESSAYDLDGGNLQVVNSQAPPSS